MSGPTGCHPGINGARVHGVYLQSGPSAVTPRGETITLQEWRAQQETPRPAVVIHRSGCWGGDGCVCGDGWRDADGQVRMYRDSAGRVRFVNAHYRQPHRGEWAVDVDGRRFKVSDRDKQL
jgi:hypothetical protein